VTNPDALIDCKGIMEAKGLKRAMAEELMRAIPKVRIGRRVFVERKDLDAEIERRKAA
jgi:hypothetical protein